MGKKKKRREYVLDNTLMSAYAIKKEQEWTDVIITTEIYLVQTKQLF